MMEDILNPLEDQRQNDIRKRIIRLGLNKYGKRAQEQHDEGQQKKARVTAEALNNITLQSLPPDQ